MKKLFAIFLLLLAPTAIHADQIGVLISEADGDPSQCFAHTLTVSDGATTSCTGGVATINTAGSGDIADVMGCSSGDCEDIVAGAADSLDMGAGQFSNPCVEAADCSAVTAEGYCCWDTDDDILYFGDGAAAVSAGNPFGSSIDDTEMANESFGDFTCTGVEDQCTLNTNSVGDNEIDYTAVTGADLTLTDCGAITSSGTITAAVGFDCTGAADCDYGSIDITDHTFTTDDCTVVIDGGLTVSTGDTITLGATAWNSGDGIDGEVIANDTIDDDAIDFADVTCADITMTDCAAITGTDIIASASLKTFSDNNPTTDAEGELAWDANNHGLEVFDGTNSNMVAMQTHHVSLSMDPGAWYDSDAEAFIMRVGSGVAGQDDMPFGIKIVEWRLTCNLDPDVEINADLRRADSFIGYANAADIDEIDTTNGVSSESTDANINAGAAIANGQVLYIAFDGDPEGTCQQMIFEFWYTVEDGN